MVDSLGIETLVTGMTYLTFTTPAILVYAPSEPIVTELQDSSILYLPDPFKGHDESRLLLDTFQASSKANLPGPEAFALTFTALEQPLAVMPSVVRFVSIKRHYFLSSQLRF